MSSAAARVDDAIDHDGHIVTGSPNVSIEGAKAARADVDSATCEAHGKTKIVEGAPTVFVNNHPLARRHDGLACGAKITAGAACTKVG